MLQSLTELELAQQRERKLKEHIEGLRKELERRYAASVPTSAPNLPRFREDPQTQSGAGSSVELEALRLKKLEEEFYAMREIVQELWISQESWNDWSSPDAPQQHASTPQHAQSSSQSPAHALCVDRMDTASSAEEAAEAVQPAAAGSGLEEDKESVRVKQKDLYHMKFPALPDNAGAFRAWRNSVVPMISSCDRSSDGAVTEWVLRAIRARSDTEIRALNESSEPYPRLDRVLASVLTGPNT